MSNRNHCTFKWMEKKHRLIHRGTGLRLVPNEEHGGFDVWEYWSRTKDKKLRRKTGTWFMDVTDDCVC